MKIFTLEFWSYAGERAIKTFAQVALSAMAGDQISIWTIGYSEVFGVAAGATLFSILTSIVAKSKA